MVQSGGEREMSADEPTSDPQLVVTFCDQHYDVLPESSLSFGRTADLVVDDNPYLHRVLGVFRYTGGLWWLHNAGSRIVLEVADCDSASLYSIRPGAQSPLHFATALVRFSAGRSSYELGLSVREAPRPAVAAPVAVGEETMTLAAMPMTTDQLRLIVALAEHALRDPFARELRIPSSRQAAQRLGWTLTRFNRKLDNVCEKLTKRGVPGLHGDIAELATDRRRRLVEYAVNAGLVSASDLVLLEGADADVAPARPRPG